MFKEVYVKHTIRSNHALNWPPRNNIKFNSAMGAPWKIQDKIFSAQLLAFEAPCLPKPLLYVKADGKLRIEEQSAFSTLHHKAV